MRSPCAYAPNFSCANQTLSFNEPNQSATMSVVEHGATAFTLIMPGSGNLSCASVAQFYQSNGSTLLGPTSGTLQTSATLTASSFVVKELSSPTITQNCVVGISDHLSPATTTYMKVVVPTGASFALVSGGQTFSFADLSQTGVANATRNLTGLSAGVTYTVSFDASGGGGLLNYGVSVDAINDFVNYAGNGQSLTHYSQVFTATGSDTLVIDAANTGTVTLTNITVQ